jgi:ribonuclease T2
VGEYLSVSPEEVEREFLKANPQLKADMISVDCKDRRLRELRICFTRDLKLKSCGVNETQQKLCSAEKLIMPPTRAAAWRSGNGDNAAEYDEDAEEEEYEENGENGDR